MLKSGISRKSVTERAYLMNTPAIIELAERLSRDLAALDEHCRAALPIDHPVRGTLPILLEGMALVEKTLKEDGRVCNSNSN
jgi:hypothetical protein